MKKFYLCLLSVFMTLHATAQLAPVPQPLDNYETIDKGKYEVRYTFKFKNHSSAKEYIEDIRVIQIGNNIVKDYSDIIFHYDSLATENFKKGHPTQSNSHQTLPCEIFNEYKGKKIAVKYRLILNAGVLCYEDMFRNLQWKYSDESPVKIMGYTCAKATTTMGGRNYTAYYTLDIPLSYGPYKFSGLPGLILKVEEENGLYIWEAFSIKNTQNPINRYTYEKEIKCSRQEARKTIARMMTKPFTFLNAAGSQVMVRQSNGRFGKPSNNEQEIKYEPIELD